MRMMTATVLGVLACASVAATQPANDDCANATVVSSLPFSDTGIDMTTATTEPGDPVSVCFGGQGSNSIWYSIPAGAEETLLRGLVAGTGTDYGIRAWTGSCGALTEIACDFSDDFDTDFGIAAEGQAYLLEIVNLDVAGTLDLSLDVFPEFLVAKGGSRRNAVGGGPNGFLVGFRDGGIQGRLYDPAGSALGPAFPLGDFDFPYDIAGAGDGSFVVVGNSAGAEAVRVDGQGLVTELPGVDVQSYARVAADADGDFVVTWTDFAGDHDLVAQRFDRDGVPLTGLITVSTTGEYPTVAAAPSGNFVVTWTDYDGDDGGIAARRFDATGTSVGGAFIVNSYTTGYQTNAAVAMDAAGNFVVAWEGGDRYFGSEYFYEPVLARRFDSDGNALGDDFLVSNNPDYYGVTSYIQIASAAGGEFIVTWEGFGFTVVDIHARRFAADGTPSGPEFFVNTSNGYSSYDPDVAATPGGEFLVSWNDFRGFSNDSIGPLFTADATLARVFRAPGLGCANTALTTCRTPTVPLKSKLLLLDDAADPARGQLRWKFVKGEATDAVDLGDPSVDEEYVLCMYDASSAAGALLMENRVFAGGTCGSKPCWKPLGNPPGSKGYRYKDKERTPNGILKVVLKPGIEGKAKIVVKGGQANVFTAAPGAPPLPLPLPVTVQLQNSSGECWQATYDIDGVGKNEPGFYKGSGS